MKEKKLLLLCSLLLAGCSLDPFNYKQDQVRESARKAEQESRKVHDGYHSEKREIAPYVVYRYNKMLDDPFRVRDFLIKKEEEIATTTKDVDRRCEPPKCIPPTPHPLQLLEHHPIGSYRFVGTLGSNVGLIKTPDIGVIEVRVGDYIGQDNGIVLDIRETVVIVQEKVLRNGIWLDRKKGIPLKW